MSHSQPAQDIRAGHDPGDNVGEPRDGRGGHDAGCDA
jgi:hypothetical protein